MENAENAARPQKETTKCACGGNMVFARTPRGSFFVANAAGSREALVCERGTCCPEKKGGIHVR